VYAISAPQNTSKVETDVREELAKALSAGFTQTEIAAAKSGLLEARKVARSSDGQLTADRAQHLYLGRDFTWDTQFEQRIATATPPTSNPRWAASSILPTSSPSKPATSPNPPTRLITVRLS
jgi:zinc protease